ncbi:MAG: hypothetical protein ABJB12_13060 [Pseudomonadota bacterium]
MPSELPNENRRTLRRAVFWRSVSALFVLTVAAFACGPSVQSIYEGNVRFEHCYRLDLEVDTAPTHREACWKEWLGMYTYGQPRDRIEYARRRVRAFASGDVDCPKLDIGDLKRAEARQFYLVVPSPTSVHASPPPVATRWEGDAGTAPPAAVTTGQLAPEDQCSAACHETYAACSAPCDPDAGKVSAPCKACGPDYKACMKRCFR